jgi:diguanylate cyclase (GGDEF)-like protein
MKKFTLWLMLGILLVILVGALDLVTGGEINFSLFYLVPIALVSWYCGRSAGITISLLSAIAWFYGESVSHQIYTNVIIRYWNTGIRLGFFLVVTLLIARLKQALNAEQELAQKDALTGVANSRYFHALVENELTRSIRFQKPLTIAYIDLDNFKFVNDHYGHDVGDQVIQLAAHAMEQSIRKIDNIGRLGGDEFAILFSETNQENASKAVNRLQQNLLAVMQDNHWPVTFSIGVFTCENPICNANQLFKEADDLMYLAKHQGKNAIRYGYHSEEIETENLDSDLGQSQT